MKIAHINKFFCAVGGAEKIMLHEAQLLQERGHEVYFFASDRQPYFIEDYQYASYFSKYTPYSKLPAAQAVMNIPKLVYDVDTQKKLDCFLKEFKPDIVHMHEFFYNLTPSIIKACKQNNTPVIMTLHTARLVCPTGKVMLKGKSLCDEVYCAKGNSLHCIVNNCFEGNFKHSAIYAAEFAARKVHKLVEQIDHFISPSRALADLAMKSGFVENRISVVNNLLERHHFNVEPRYNNQNYFLYVGRLAHDKGVQYLIKAFSMLPKEIELHLVGTGPQEEDFKLMAKEYGLDNVRFLGFKSGKELYDIYKGCIASILTCYWFENFPTTILETFVNGKPAIGSNIGGIPEMVEPGVTGLLTEPANPEDIARAVETLYNDKQKAIEMGKNARKKAEENYHPDIHYEKLIEIYRKYVK